MKAPPDKFGCVWSEKYGCWVGDNASFERFTLEAERFMQYCINTFKAMAPGRWVLIYSVYRTTGTHASGGCFDLIFEGMHNEIKKTRSSTRKALLKVQALAELAFPYGLGHDGLYHRSFVYDTSDGNHNGHAHGAQKVG